IMDKANSFKSDYDANTDINYKFLTRAKSALAAGDVDKLNKIGKDMGKYYRLPGAGSDNYGPDPIMINEFISYSRDLIQRGFDETDHETGKSYHVDFSPKSAKDLYDNMFGYLDK
ncbi:MAG: hypothetical protein WAW91_01075, partial [Candidatus Nanoperiomorbaceae bacterium]